MNESQERAIRVVKRLFNLADSTHSQAEAESAVINARKILEKYNLSLSDTQIENEDEFLCSSAEIDLQSQRIATWIKILCSAIINGFGIQIIQRRTQKISLLFVGVEPDLSISLETFNYIFNHLQKIKGLGRASGDYRNGFCQAIFLRLQKHKEEQSQENVKHENTLMLVKDKVIDKYLNNYFNNAKLGKARKPKFYANEAYYKGYEDGMLLSINRQLKK